MTTNLISKPIRKTDDSSKEFIINNLKNNPTRGIDIDSLYFANNKYYIFEYLKCDSDYATPYTSHPKRYPSNWKKFYSLWTLSQKLNACLLLVNYSDREKDKDQVKLMEVKGIDFDILNKYIKNPTKGSHDYLQTEDYDLTATEFSDYLIQLNNSASMPVFN